ncbi:MAG: hypothetical protein R2861_14380 [Desulfobacterales bacterium]
MQTIIKNANQMSHIVDDLLELRKLQQNRKPFHELAAIDGAACFRSAAELPCLCSRKKLSGLTTN